jgi:DNA-binding protein H-NS
MQSSPSFLLLPTGANGFCIIGASNWNGEGIVATYLELKAQAEDLLAQAERMREQEIANAISDIKEKIRLYGLTAQDLGLAPSGPRRAGKTKSPVKYRGPNGETWSGGRGRKPAWVSQALKDGRRLEDFAVTDK